MEKPKERILLELLEFSIGGFFTGDKIIKIWRENNKVFKSYKGYFNAPGNEYAEEITAEEVKMLEERLAEIKIGSWKKEYVDPYVLDGIQWNLKYKVQGKRCRHIYGSNDYPENWDEFIDAVGAVIIEVLGEKNKI